MPSLNPKDRVSLCLFSFADGRRCRTPRTGTHPHFCFYHAQKEAQSQAAEKLAKDLSYFFSGDYLSACDLNTALSRLIPAVIRGEIKPRVARTVAYMLQTLLQSTRLAQHEYINAFGTTGWREAVHTSVTANQDYLFPPDPDPDDQSDDDSEDAPEPDAHQPASSTLVGAGPVNSEPRRARPDCPAQPTPRPIAETRPPSTTRPSPADTDAALAVARSIFPNRSNAAPSQPTVPTMDSASPAPQPTIPTNPSPEAASHSGPHFFSRRRHHNASIHPFGTNIYTRPGNH